MTESNPQYFVNVTAPAHILMSDNYVENCNNLCKKNSADIKGRIKAYKSKSGLKNHDEKRRIDQQPSLNLTTEQHNSTETGDDLSLFLHKGHHVQLAITYQK